MDAAAFASKIRSAFAHCSLGAWPTPLDAAPALSRASGPTELWLKREDLAGGNKVRGLEFLLVGARPGTVFVTVGGTGSSHCLATAIHGRRLGARIVLAQFPQPETDASRAVAAATARAADVVVHARSQLTLPWAVLRALAHARRLVGGTPRWIPGGGAHPRAVLGHVLATLELPAQIDAGAPPDAIVVPLGTGGTAAGILLGIAYLGWPTRVVAVRVATRFVANQWRTVRLARKAAELLEERDEMFRLPRSPFRISVVDGLGPGYGVPSPVGERARLVAASHGLRLDPTYGAKAFAAIPGKPRIVFWNTFAWP